MLFFLNFLQKSLEESGFMSTFAAFYNSSTLYNKY